MKTKNIITYIIAFTILFSGCNDYLDVEPKGKVIPTTVEDFDLLLNGGGWNGIHTTSDENALFLSADDFSTNENKIGDLNDPENVKFHLFTWDDNLFQSENRQVNLWNNSFGNIYTYNLIIENIDEAELGTTGTTEAKNRIKAESMVGRAYEYWILVNSFGKQYEASTADSDLGVPLVLEANSTAQTSSRATIQEVYNQIISDLTSSIDHLPVNAVNKIRPSKGTAYALLARTYLSMGDYANAKTNASLALNEKSALVDYTAGFAPGDYEALVPEQYMMRFFGYTRGFTDGFITAEVRSLYDEINDTRFTSILAEDGGWVFINGGWQYISSGEIANSLSFNMNHCVSVPEMYLTRAECNARLAEGTLAEIQNDMDLLRNNRIIANTPLSLTNKNEALIFVLEERRREMLLTGTRLFDLKRLNLESQFAKTITHVIDGLTYTLEPNSDKYVFPIPGIVINFNPGMQINPR